MDSFSKGDQGRMGMSVEGKILERDPKDHTIIKKCQIRAVALTMNPVNTDTHCDIAKSLNTADLDFDSTGDHTEPVEKSEETSMPISQVLQIIEKALSVSGAYADSKPSDLSDGDAMAQEDMDKKKKKESMKKSLRKLTKSEYSYNLKEMLGNLQTLYPQYSRTHIWDCVKERLNTTYPDMEE